MMPRIYHCKDCGADFLAPHYEKYVELHPELDGDWSEVMYFARCPECGSEFVEESWACECCSAHPSASGSQFCIACQMRADDALEEAIHRLERVLDTDNQTAAELLDDALQRYCERSL